MQLGGRQQEKKYYAGAVGRFWKLQAPLFPTLEIPLLFTEWLLFSCARSLVLGKGLREHLDGAGGYFTFFFPFFLLPLFLILCPITS